METSKKMLQKEIVRKKDSNRTEKGKCRVKYTKKQDKKCNIWLEQNLTPRKTSANMLVLEHMVETRAWKEVRGLTENSQCRLCEAQRETVQHLLAGCKVLASSEYLERHNRALMVMAVAWAEEQNLLHQNLKWYQEKWKRGHDLENSQAS